MAQTTTTAPTSLRSVPKLSERIDLPRWFVFIAASSMILIVGLLLAFITWQGIQVFIKDGYSLSEMASSNWDPVADTRPVFGLAPFAAATVCVTALALLIATPLAVGLAIFLSEVAPGWARAVVQPALEIFVGIPSVVWGWLGITALVPFLRDTFGGPIVVSLPGFGQVFSMPGFGSLGGFSWLAGSLVVSVMILPTVTSVSYDSFRAVPNELRTGSLALGTTRWQTIRHIVVPAALSGVLTALVLGMTRATGEALAVQMVIGNSPSFPRAISQPLTTLTSEIAQDMGGTVLGEPFQDALWTMSLVLLAMSLTSVVLVRLINRRRLAA